jgi:hypothetical protein
MATIGATLHALTHLEVRGTHVTAAGRRLVEACVPGINIPGK